MSEELMLGWDEAAAAGAPVCGGKGWNLGRLYRYGFRVPGGGVLTANAYRRFMAPLGALVERVRSIGPTDAAEPAASALLEELRGAICEAPFQSDVAAAVMEHLQRTGLWDRPVAVRSSATAEDGAEASFAGIHESYLHVTGPEAVLEAVKRCYASLWTPRALAYRRRLGLADEEVACAVVICEMVTAPGSDQPVAAGVAFSCDPRTGNRSEITISAAPGLGEAVVSGSVNPEEIRLTMARQVLDLAGRTGRPVLTDQQALELGRITWRIHWALGAGQDPQDVEWAFDGSRFWVLQARPVTKLTRVIYREVAHLPVIWSNANIKDNLIGVPTTFTAGMSTPLIRTMIEMYAELGGCPLPGAEIIRRFGGRPYFDLTFMLWAAWDGLGIAPELISRLLGGAQPVIHVPPGSPFRGRRGLQRAWNRVRLLGKLIRVMRTLRGELAQARAEVRRLMSADMTTAAGPELQALVDRMHRLRARLGPRIQIANQNAGMPLDSLTQALEKAAPGRGRALANALLAGTGGVASAEAGYRLWEMARCAREDHAALHYLREPADPSGWRKLPSTSAFRQAMEAFLAEFGHRAPNEAEVSNLRWAEDQSYLLQQVRAFLDAPAGRHPRAAAAATKAAAAAELARAPLPIRLQARFLAGWARRAAALREEAKSVIALLFTPDRAVCLEAGRRMAAVGVLAAPADVFHLSPIDVEQFLRGEWDGSGAMSLVADRRTADEAWQAAVPPDVLILDAEGRPASLPSGDATAARVEAKPAQLGDHVLQGIGVAAGRACGPARIIRSPEEGHRLQHGDVLVAPSTDPGWTPLFLRASAIVMEVGGYLSHGATVAREYGIPAVVNIPGVMSALDDGRSLTVDGDQGVVSLS